MSKIDSFGAVALAASLCLLTACVTDPYTGEKKVSKAATGAVIGGATGAAIGAATGGDRGKRAGIGAAAGAVAGGAVGAYMDHQEAKLREQLQGTGVSVTRAGDELILNMPGNITFDVDQSSIRSDFYDVLNSVVLVVKEFDKTNIEVSGFTDSTGSDQYNQELSERRAASVGSYITSQGVAAGRVWTRGFGERNPVADNNTAAGRERNRRVELKLIPITS
ncbi:MAG: OmpA family protein [Deltaproteobacteria bacterium]|jgi:outer membrane protein OmpA-like peptidoglycan-associated protein|nr:OmpA family protein [Deltaproteobacteria bacterium]